MNKLSLLVPIFAAITLFAQPVFADTPQRHEKCAHMAPGVGTAPATRIHNHESMMQDAIEKMQAQMATINQAKDPKKRQKLLQEHNKSMRDSIKTMREMMNDTAMGCATGSSHRMSDHKRSDHKMDSQKLCDHKRAGNPVSQFDDKATATPAAQANPDAITATDKTLPNPEKKLWVCPMHPGVVSDQAGACPICGMDLEETEQPGASQSEHSHPISGGMKDDCMMGGRMKGPMMNMANKRMEMMLILMEQMIEHNSAEMAIRK